MWQLTQLSSLETAAAPLWEHDRIRGYMDVLDEFLAASDMDAAGERLDVLTTALLSHQAREERLLELLISA